MAAAAPALEMGQVAQLPFAGPRRTLKAVPVPVETVLITGATGFVGSHVVEALAGPGQRIRALVRDPAKRAALENRGIEVIPGSLEDAESVRQAVDGVDVVVHLAAATRATSEAGFARANATGTETVTQAILSARRPPRRLIYLSSLAAAGPAIAGRPIKAEDPPAPLTAYGRTKLAGEQISRQAEAVAEVAILRAPAVYGPRDRDVYEFFRLAALGVLPVPTGGDRPLQMIHAADLARAVALAATGTRVQGVYHTAEARAYLWSDVARMVAEAVGRKARILRVPAGLIMAAGAMSELVARVIGRPSIFSRDKARELLAPGWLCETEAARLELGFEAAIPLATGLADTAAWYREHGWL